MAPNTFYITGDERADGLLAADPLALLIGMLLDQQVPMEWAFAGPLRLQERLGYLDAAAIADMDVAQLEAVAKEKPAIHRYPGAMAKRIHALCQHLVEHHGGDAAAVWEGAETGHDALARLLALPGFGEEKARIFLAVLGKRLGIAPPGWQDAAAPFSDDTPRSVADVTSAELLGQVRDWKRANKGKKDP